MAPLNGVYTGSGRAFVSVGVGFGAGRKEPLEAGAARAGSISRRTDGDERTRAELLMGAFVEVLSDENSRSPAKENVPIISTRISQTIMATKIGTTLSRIGLSITGLPMVASFRMAIETPHQVNMAFMVAAKSQAPKRYQTSLGSSLPCSGVKRRAIPAKSMPQKAIAKIVDQ